MKYNVMIPLQKGRFLEYSLRNRTLLLLREHTQVLPYKSF